MQYVFAFSLIAIVTTACFVFFSLLLCLHFESISLSFYISFFCVLFCFALRFILFLSFIFHAHDGWASVIWWGLICLVKHANSSKGLFKITNLAWLFDSPSPFIYCRFANHKNQLAKKDYRGYVWIFHHLFIYIYLNARTPFINTAIFLWMVSSISTLAILSLFSLFRSFGTFSAHINSCVAIYIKAIYLYDVECMLLNGNPISIGIHNLQMFGCSDVAVALKARVRQMSQTIVQLISSAFALSDRINVTSRCNICIALK